ncbi:PAS domain-containing protein [Pedobacter metabolipauper]|uniref:histidine kinase n=2 Tax=Pedobacter metabolipauper TaxID=425513 RepID=A0A4R6SVR5_9SPHI|nr:PAS domain-containing protein [Pedobacter metabolipauper]
MPLPEVLNGLNGLNVLSVLTSDNFLYDQLPTGFISFRPDGSIIRINQTFLSWLEMPNDNTVKENFKSILTKACAVYYTLVIEPLLNLQPHVNEISLSFKTATGSFDALFNAVSYTNDQGNLMLVNASVQKITYRKKYEAELLYQKRLEEEQKSKFEFLSNTVPNQIWTASPDGQLAFINQRVKDYFNINDPAQLGGALSVYEEDKEKTIEAWKSCLQTGKKFEKEIRLQGTQQYPEWFLVTAQPFYNEQGEIELWFGSSTNIHKQKSLQLANYSALSESLTTAHKTIDENTETLESIAENQSHMIRKPLANMLGLINLLKLESMSPECSSLFKLLEHSATELDTMIKEVSNQI